MASAARLGSMASEPQIPVLWRADRREASTRATPAGRAGPLRKTRRGQGVDRLRNIRGDAGKEELEMIRKLLLVAVATAAPFGVLAATAGVASAGTTVDATTATVTCTGISGTVKFTPPVTTSESAGTGKTSIKASLSGCTTNDGVTVTGAKASGTLTTTRTAGENGCVALAGGSDATGPLTVKWKTSPKLSSGSSVVQVNSVKGSIGGNGNADFTIPGTIPNGTPSGSFQGTDNGAGDTTSAQTTTSAGSILATCEGKKGLKSIAIASPQSGNAVSLG
jgi:hypothetical protein